MRWQKWLMGGIASGNEKRLPQKSSLRPVRLSSRYLTKLGISFFWTISNRDAFLQHLNGRRLKCVGQEQAVELQSSSDWSI